MIRFLYPDHSLERLQQFSILNSMLPAVKIYFKHSRIIKRTAPHKYLFYNKHPFYLFLKIMKTGSLIKTGADRLHRPSRLCKGLLYRLIIFSCRRLAFSKRPQRLWIN